MPSNLQNSLSGRLRIRESSVRLELVSNLLLRLSRIKTLLLRKKRLSSQGIVNQKQKIMEGWYSKTYSNTKLWTSLIKHSRKTWKKCFNRRKKRLSRNLKKIRPNKRTLKDPRISRTKYQLHKKLATKLKRSSLYLGTMRTPYRSDLINHPIEVTTSECTGAMLRLSDTLWKTMALERFQEKSTKTGVLCGAVVLSKLTIIHN